MSAVCSPEAFAREAVEEEEEEAMEVEDVSRRTDPRGTRTKVSSGIGFVVVAVDESGVCVAGACAGEEDDEECSGTGKASGNTRVAALGGS